MAREEQAGEAHDSLGVLLVEDDDGDALLVADDLAETLPDARLARARSLAEAFSFGEGADCVLLDLGLPDAHGMDPVARLRERFEMLPIVVLTGLADEAAGVAAVRAGAQDYLVKGRLEPGQLARAIRYAIGRRQTADAERELLLAEAQAREVERLERGLAPDLVLNDAATWVVSCNRPGRSRALLGGDFLDVVQDPAGRLHAVIGDVCGHGPDEAALGVALRAAWRALTLARASSDTMLATLQLLFEQERHLPRLFVTLCTIELDPEGLTAEAVLAGHPRPLLIAGTEVEPLMAGRGAPAIGLVDGPWEVQRARLPDGWALLLYTDGIIEGRVGKGPERLGEAGLRRILTEQLAGDPQWREHPGAILDLLVERTEAMNGGPLTDDVAMLLIGTAAEAR